MQADKAALQDLAVRFSCASRELQFLGLIKESSRSRKDGTVQRLAYPMRAQAAGARGGGAGDPGGHPGGAVRTGPAPAQPAADAGRAGEAQNPRKLTRKCLRD